MPIKKSPGLAKLKSFLELPAFPAKCNKIAKDALGVELEHEFPQAILLDHIRMDLREELGRDSWIVENDGSLRGNGLEFISRPLVLDNLLEHIRALYDKFDKYKAVPNHSHRTSTHVHLNFSKNTMLEVYQFLLLYYFLEPTLFCLTEEDRWNNTFCVSSETIPYHINDLSADYIPFWGAFNDKNKHKYASLNLAPFTELGTLESRIYHGAYDVNDLCNWVTALDEVKKFAVSFKGLKELYKYLEETDFKTVLKKVFVTTFPFVSEHIAMREKKLYDLANLGNARAYPLLSIERRLQEAKDFFVQEQERMKLLMEKQRELEKNIEQYNIFDDLEPV